jgi:hypothetical protein
MAKNSSIYQKRGNLNFKERKLISDINSAMEKNPELEQGLTPANSFDELKELHTRFLADEVAFEEVPNTNAGASEPVTKQAPLIDPLNRDEPNVRDYVMDDKFDPFADFQKGNTSTYQEPTNYGQAFDLPDEDEMRGGSQQKSNSNQRPQKSNSNQRPQPINSGDDSGKDKRRSKRFAKSIVNTTCSLLEVGFVWYATKDINEQKLAEYELTSEINVNAILSMPDGSEATVKEFFISQFGQIEQASKISQEERDDLIDSLTEVFIEKNIQPSPTYELGINALSIIAKQGIKLYVISSQNSQIINQLREQNALQRESNMPRNEPIPKSYATPEPSDNYPPQNPNSKDYVSPEYIANLELARADKEARKDERLSRKLFDSEPNEDTIRKASESVLLDTDSLIDNELSLLDEIPTKE